MALVVLMTTVFVVIVVLALLAILELIFWDGNLLGIDSACGPAGTSCSLLSSLVLSLFPISIAVVWVFLVRLEWVRYKYRQLAQDHPARLLETDIPSPHIVGRDDLCEVLQKDLQSRWHPPEEASGESELGTRTRERRTQRRRPIVLVGGVGIGKTAVLARLTQLLAERGAVPVPIRLRTAQDGELDFLDLARRKFMWNARVLSEAEGDKIWRRLRENDQLVIVADGLEEALMTVTDTRETSIRVAFEQLRRHGVALIVSSRPHEALTYLDAAMVTLEPLEPRAALEYITGRRDLPERSRESKIVQAAEVADMPLYMHIARELCDVGALEGVDARDVGRLGIRVRLLDRWMEVLQEGRIQPASPVKPKRRREVITSLQSFASCGLMNDSLEVTFEDLTREDPAEDVKAGRTDPLTLKETLDATTEKLREVAADGELLGLVDARPEGVRFRHSVTQAYLGSRAITRVLTHGPDTPDGKRLSESLEKGLHKPGRELLMALAMSCAICDEPARIRAIRLLLRNVDDEGSKAVYTASAVIAAASASTERVGRIAHGDDTWPGVAHHRRRDFRKGVVLWLKRAESEDAEREAEKARRRAEEADVEAQAARDESSAAVLARIEREEEASRVGETAAEAATGRARKAQADAALRQAHADVAAAREKVDRARSAQAAAQSELAVAKTILAEKKLAEAEADTNAAKQRGLRIVAERSLEGAIGAVNESRLRRRDAERAEDQVFDEQSVGTGALAERLVAEMAIAEHMLGEAGREATPADAAKRLVTEAASILTSVLELAAQSRLLLAATAAALREDEALGEGECGREDLLLAEAERTLAELVEAEAESNDDKRDDLRAEVAVRLGAVSETAVEKARAREREGAKAHLSAFSLAARAVATACRARRTLTEAADRPAEEARELRGEVIAQLGELIREAAKLQLGDRQAAIRSLPLAGLVAVKAEGAHAGLKRAGALTDEGQRRELREEIITSLREVSKAVEAAKLGDGEGARTPGDARRATSRTQVLVPLRKTTRHHDTQADEGVQSAKLDAVARLYDGAQFAWLWEVCKHERDPLVRMSAARKLGDGGSVAFTAVKKELKIIEKAAGAGEGPPSHDDATAVLVAGGVNIEQPGHAFQLLGWLLPVLYSSIEREAARAAANEAELAGRDPLDVQEPDVEAATEHREFVTRWVRRVRAGIFITSNVALAQGLRFAANHRDLPAGQQGFLSARAEDLLGKTKFWFSRIALLQAITLWMLSHTERAAADEDSRDPTSDREAEDKIYKCCEHAGHPFVKEAIRLCVKALRRRQPANYIWLDESLATARLGSGPDAVRTGGTDSYWIPPSAGWLSLASEAQRLLGDLVVFLNLVDRGDDHASTEEYLQRTVLHDHQELPPCMSTLGGRAHLDVNRRLGVPMEPGGKCVPGCEMRLCPYPGLGEDMSRGELSEAFCRTQHELVSHGRSIKRPEWQKAASVDELKRFWRDMERRPRA